MIERYINNSLTNVDNFFKDDRWLYRIKVNDYQLITIFWNLFLIIVPFFLCHLLIKYWQKTGYRKFLPKVTAFLIAALWLLFVPNAAYVMSEVRHLLDYCPPDSPFRVCEKNAWMPLFFFAYASIGWVTYVLLINQMKWLVKEVFGRWLAHIYVLAIIPLISLGFLIGLINRWNSWEIFVQPFKLYKNLLVYFSDPLYFTNWLIFTILLYALYFGGNWVFKDRFK